MNFEVLTKSMDLSDPLGIYVWVRNNKYVDYPLVEDVKYFKTAIKISLPIINLHDATGANTAR